MSLTPLFLPLANVWILQLTAHSLDVVLISKDDDGASTGSLHQPLDEFVKLAQLGFSGDFDGLGDTDATWQMQKS